MNGTSISRNTSEDKITWDDATWILTSSFIILTMQSGFGLLEAGSVSSKNEVNIMVKNAVDVIFGGITYWLFGFGVSFGHEQGSNAFTGFGYFALDVSQHDEGVLFATFVFQLSFATTATTIVSGAMAERTKLSSYIAFSFLNTITYCFPAHWVWGKKGFLRNLGCVDIAGSGVVHLCGGTSALIATLLLGPRNGRYNHKETPPMGNPTNVLIGMFMLWWGWLGFNCGSTFGISGNKWILAARSAVTTLNSSIAGGITGMVISFIAKKRKFNVAFLVNSVLGSLVSITACCAVVRTWESLIIGSIGAALTIGGTYLLDFARIDDPVGAVSVHGIGGVWGMIAAGLFVERDRLENITQDQIGLFRGHSAYLLGIQALAVVCIGTWSALLTFIMLMILKKTIGIRLTVEEEILGADFVEHGIKPQESGFMCFSCKSRKPSFADGCFSCAELGSQLPEHRCNGVSKGGDSKIYPENDNRAQSCPLDLSIECVSKNYELKY